MTSVIGTRVDSITYSRAIEIVLGWSTRQESRYICVANVHMLMEAYDSLLFRQIINFADLVTSDGMPLVWMMRLKGHRNLQRVYGPTLMLHVLEMAVRENVPVGCYGGDPDTLNLLIRRMQTQYPSLNVVFYYSPPFRVLKPDEDVEIVARIKKSGARILFVGLGCPKQEKWMAEHRGRIPAVMLGVGAAFDFHAGMKSQAPSWMQKIGLEWLYRFIQEPDRLWRRYLIQNPRFVVLAIADLLGFFKAR